MKNGHTMRSAQVGLLVLSCAFPGVAASQDAAPAPSEFTYDWNNVVATEADAQSKAETDAFNAELLQELEDERLRKERERAREAREARRMAEARAARAREEQRRRRDESFDFFGALLTGVAQGLTAETQRMEAENARRRREEYQDRAYWLRQQGASSSASSDTSNRSTASPSRSGSTRSSGSRTTRSGSQSSARSSAPRAASRPACHPDYPDRDSFTRHITRVQSCSVSFSLGRESHQWVYESFPYTVRVSEHEDYRWRLDAIEDRVRQKLRSDARSDVTERGGDFRDEWVDCGARGEMFTSIDDAGQWERREREGFRSDAGRTYVGNPVKRFQVHVGNVPGSDEMTSAEMRRLHERKCEAFTATLPRD